jgi:hypothetical protein
MGSKLSSWLFAVIGVFFGIAGCLVVCWLEWGFYQEVSLLPWGTEIRPMGLAFDELVVSFLTFILAVPLSVAGAYFAVKRRRRAFGILSFFGLVFGFLPFPLSLWLGWKIIAVTGVVPEQ